MKFLPYVLKHLRRNWVRTTSTVMALSVCIFLFCTLQTVLAAVSFGLQAADARRLVVRHNVSIVFELPRAYEERIRAIPGVRQVAISSWFGGSLKAKQETVADDADSGPDWSNFFPNFAVEPEAYLSVYPELMLSPEEKQAFLQDRRGCVIGRALAKKFKWKVGDTFFLESFISPYRKADGPFEFTVRGIYDPDPSRPAVDDNLMLFQYDYLYEGTGRRVAVGTYVVEIDDPAKAGAIAQAIDAVFENSDAQTKTETEAAFRAGFIAMAGNLAFLLNSIGLAVIFTILLVTANTMSMAVRERRTEIAVLKTLGFPSSLVLLLVMGEAVALGALGGLVGVGLGSLMVGALRAIPTPLADALRQYPHAGLSPSIAGAGLGLSLLIGLLAGLVPATLAYRARITETLRQA